MEEKQKLETQKGIALPDDFANALKSKPELLAVLERMRPSCQQDYVHWIEADSENRAQRIDRVLEKIVRWGKRHQLLVG
jgi:uncharacterized protein YdeI (YjbR/CyaY-like superfamily)